MGIYLDNLLNYLNTLLGIEVAIFGIISAVIFVFIQLVYSNYSYKHISHIIKNAWLILFFVSSVLDLILTSFGGYFLSVDSQNIYPKLYSFAVTSITNPLYGLTCLILMLVSILFFTILIVKNITYLQPHRAILLLAKNIHYGDVRDFIWRKYDLEPPYTLRFRIVPYLITEKGSKKTEENRKANQKKKEKEDDKKLLVIEKQIKAIKKKTANVEDPLISIRDLMIQFIRRTDLSSLSEACNRLLSVSNIFINNVPNKKADKWSPEDVLLRNFTHYLIEMLSTLLEIAEKEGLESAKNIVLIVGYEYSSTMLQKRNYSEIEIILEFLQSIADASIGKSSIVFQNIMRHFQTTAEGIFDSLKNKPGNEEQDGRLRILDTIFRSIGWLGERLLTKLPIEDTPIMMNYDYSTNYGSLLNCLVSLGDRYDHDHPNLYPLIYFDAIYVVIKKLIKINKVEDLRRLEENIYDFAFAFRSYAESAIRVGNINGAYLAAMRIKETYEIVKEASMDKLAENVIKLMVRIGFMAASIKDKLSTVSSMVKPLEQFAADALVESGVSIKDEVLDNYLDINSHLDHDASWNFLVNLGMRLRTNFGFTFDPSTGKMYPDDDTRRK